MMARIDALDVKETARTSVHAPVEASYVTFSANGESYLQIMTYGAPDRQAAGVVSQTMQFGPKGIAALRLILAGLPK
jgi:hypothetical protein